MRPAIRLLLLLAGLLPALPPPAAAASTLGAFNAAVAGAMRHYRYAGYYLRTGNVALAAIELDAMRGKWRALAARYAAAPPDAFADDPRFAATLSSVAARVAAALGALDADNAAGAAARIGPIGDAVAALRRRNGIRIYADCIGDMDRAFATAWKYRRAPPDFADARQADAVRAAIAVVDYWYRRCHDRAPAAVAKRAEFRRLMDDAHASIRRLWRAVRTKNRLLLVNTLRELHALDRLIYLKFG